MNTDDFVKLSDANGLSQGVRKDHAKTVNSRISVTLFTNPTPAPVQNFIQLFFLHGILDLSLEMSEKDYIPEGMLVFGEFWLFFTEQVFTLPL